MPGLLTDVDPNGLLEYSVVFTDRSLNHMSKSFQKVMTDISQNLKSVYNAESVIVIPGGGTFGMEAIARQFAAQKKCLVLRNGWFSYRWSEIIEKSELSTEVKVLKAKRSTDNFNAAFTPVDLETAKSEIVSHRPHVVFAPHVETSAGIILPDSYLKEIADATHSVGGLFILDCVASGAMWVDMKNLGMILQSPKKSLWRFTFDKKNNFLPVCKRIPEVSYGS